MKNITLAVDDQVLADVRRYAAANDTTVNALVRGALDRDPDAMRRRREAVEHPFGTIKARMGATHLLCRTLPEAAAEMALHVLAYNMTRVLNIMGVRPLLAAIRG